MEVRNHGVEPEMNRGFLQILVLLVLEKSMYGYQMIKSFLDLGYPVEENTLYPLLRRLEKNGWIKSHWEIEKERPKKYYIITDDGKLARSSFLDIWKRQRKIIEFLIMEVEK